MTESSFNIQTTSMKNGGFRHYVQLPPQTVFQHVYWVLGAELDVRIKRKRTFFNRETDWMRLPVYLTIHKGMLIIYSTRDSGYCLRISGSKKLTFEASKKPTKTPSPIHGGNFIYSAIMTMAFSFGELHLRFTEGDDLRSWRTLLLAAHQSPQGLHLVGESVARELFRSSSLESVVSTKSVAPTKNNKQKEEIIIHRHRRELTDNDLPEEEGPRTTQDDIDVSEVAEEAVESSSALSKASSLSSSIQKKDVRASMLSSGTSDPSERSHRSVLETGADEIESDYEESMTQHGGDKFLDVSNPWESRSFVAIRDARRGSASILSQSKISNGDGTSEVDVTCNDFSPLDNCSSASVHTAISKFADGNFGYKNLTPLENCSSASVHTAISKYADGNFGGKDLTLENCSSASVHTAISKYADVPRDDHAAKETTNPFDDVEIDDLVAKALEEAYAELKAMEDPVAPAVATSLNLEPSPVSHVKKVTFALRSPATTNTREPFVKKAPIPTGRSPKEPNVLNFWKQKETENAMAPFPRGIGIKSQGPRSLITTPKKKVVHFPNAVVGHTSGKVLNSPTKYFGSVDEAAAAVAHYGKISKDESHI